MEGRRREKGEVEGEEKEREEWKAGEERDEGGRVIERSKVSSKEGKEIWKVAF